MKRIVPFVLGVLLLVPSLVSAQGVELTAFGGYNLGGSLDIREDTRASLNTKDSFSGGLGLAWQKSPKSAFELYWGFRPTKIEGEDQQGATQDLGSLDTHDFHANFIFSNPYRGGKVSPFLLLGLGGTLINPGEVNGQSPEDKFRFSWALGAGVKTVNAKGVGLRLQARYHSMYVTDQYAGTWCSYYGYCYSAVESNWLDEWDFQAGLVFHPGKK